MLMLMLMAVDVDVSDGDVNVCVGTIDDAGVVLVNGNIEFDAECDCMLEVFNS